MYLCTYMHIYNTYGKNRNKWKEMISKKFKTSREQSKEYTVDFKGKFNSQIMGVVKIENFY